MIKIEAPKCTVLWSWPLVKSEHLQQKYANNANTTRAITATTACAPSGESGLAWGDLHNPFRKGALLVGSSQEEEEARRVGHTPQQAFPLTIKPNRLPLALPCPRPQVFKGLEWLKVL